MPQANYYSTRVVHKGLSTPANDEAYSNPFDLNGLQRFNPVFVSTYAATHASTTGLEIYAQFGIGFRKGQDAALDALLEDYGDDHGILWAANEIDLTDYLEDHTTGLAESETKVSVVNLDIDRLAQYCRFRVVNTDVTNANSLNIYGAC